MNTTIDKDLLSIQEARILAENAKAAQKVLATYTQEQLDAIVDRMAEEINKYAKELAKMSAEETDYGVWQDKYIKNRFVCEYLRGKLKGLRCVGIIHRDEASKTMDVGVPIGVIASLCPATSPVSTTIYKVLIAVKAGDAIVVSPHPRAQKTIGRVLDIMIEAGEKCGLPTGAVSYLHAVAKAGTVELMNHKAVDLILIAGVPSMLEAASKAGKPVIYGGTGNGPVFVERTADIPQAVHEIVISKTFDNGVVTGGEQSVVVDGVIADEVKRELQKAGAYFMTEEEAGRLGKVLFPEGSKTDPEMAGKSAKYLARRARIQVPDNTVLLISEQKYVSETNPYSREKLCPVLAYYVEDDWMHACEKCIELLLSERRGHTLTIHSRDEAVIEQFALKKPVARVLVNTPATFGALGITTNLFPAMTLGSGSAGRGSTSDNVSPMNLIYIRKVGYGVRKVEDMYGPCGALNLETMNTGSSGYESVKMRPGCDQELAMLKNLLDQVLENR